MCGTMWDRWARRGIAISAAEGARRLPWASEISDSVIRHALRAVLHLGLFAGAS